MTPHKNPQSREMKYGPLNFVSLDHERIGVRGGELKITKFFDAFLNPTSDSLCLYLCS